MSTIPPLNLASNPALKVSLREATVADCLDFAEVSPDHEEEITTLFLNRIQEQAGVTDSRQWTAEDRRLALFWYWLHTSEDPTIPVTYQCSHCGNEHSWLCHGTQIAEGYRSLQGEPFRASSSNGQEITVRPLDGADMEMLEVLRMVWQEAITTHGATSGEARRKERELDIARLVAGVTFKWDDSELDSFDRRMAHVTAMGFRAFTAFAELVVTLLEEMAHGLPSVYDDGKIFLLTPDHECPNTPGRTTRIRVPFRPDDFIPGL